MPHDANGKTISKGDEVWIPCIAKEVYAAEDFCNVTLETKIPMPGNDSNSTFTLNTKQTVLQTPAGIGG